MFTVANCIYEIYLVWPWAWSESTAWLLTVLPIRLNANEKDVEMRNSLNAKTKKETPSWHISGSSVAEVLSCVCTERGLPSQAAKSKFAADLQELFTGEKHTKETI